MFEQTLSSEGSDRPSGRKSRFFSAALALHALGLLAVLGASLWAVEDPEAARKARLQGDVVLEAIITARGEIEEVPWSSRPERSSMQAPKEPCAAGGTVPRS